MTNLSEKIERAFPDQRIVIVGDLVADQFLRGTISRVSREAPVFILRHDETETLAGGAGNAAANVASLGGKAALVGIAGNDTDGAALLEVLSGSNIDCRQIIVSDDIRTTTKVRVLAGQHYASLQQVIRIDYENRIAPDTALAEQLRENVRTATENADAIIISDYNYGVASVGIFELCRQIAAEKKIPLLIDSRFRLQEFRNATTATPNQDEVEQILGEDFTDGDCAKLRETLDLEALLVTCGNQGMLLIEKDKPPVRFEVVGSKQPVDVTGAGDTVIAAYALALAAGLSFAEAAQMANHAGGIVVMKKGTATVEPDELLESLRINSEEDLRSQISNFK
jgi:D-glycero-beta-D-manno-heptose-7-phosphate kinase